VNYKKLVYLNLLLISASIICFEIISTRISSVIFVNNYAFIILSLAILGLGSGGIFSYYKIRTEEAHKLSKVIVKSVILIGVSFDIFIIAVIELSITNPFVYFFLLSLPFFCAGIVYAQLFKIYAEHSFKLYASDLTGAALGSGASIAAFHLFNAPNAILFLSLIIFASAVSFAQELLNKKKRLSLYSPIFLFVVLLVIYGNKNYLGQVPIGDFPEKDFYHVYPNLNDMKYEIADSRWSLYGRSDLVEYSHQDMVKQLFIDGAAGTQMYHFNGDIQNPGTLLFNHLIRNPTAIPFMFLREHEKNRMLVIGPGGGKEVLIGLLSGVEQITGVEINPDFVNIVKKYSSFNGGIYTDFPNVKILVKEGRHYIKKTDQNHDLIVMALPSTEQLQNIDNLALSENYLLTVEAIQDYLKILTPEGRLIFTVHNRWELIRLIVTTLSAFNKMGISNQEALKHFIILAQDYTPTLVIKKNAFSKGEIAYIKNVIRNIPQGLPSVTYLPFNWEEVDNTIGNKLLRTVIDNRISLQQYINQDQYDISPVYDDSPYFYKLNRGVPDDYLWLLMGVAFFGGLVISVPFSQIKKKINKNRIKVLILPLIIFMSIGTGFMILEVSLFQKLILYLGSPTISLSILLSSLLIGMGTGSFFGKRIYPNNLKKRLNIISLLIVPTGVLTFSLYPYILNELLAYSQVVRSIVCFILIIPFGFLLGIPFPSAIQLLKRVDMEKYIPWMYGVNGIMSVFGSVLAVILSMLFGFTPAFFIGLSLYLVVFLVTLNLSESI